MGAHLSIAGGLQKAVSRAESVGATALQIFTRNQRRWTVPPLQMEQVAAFRVGLRDSRIGFLCTHASYLCNLASSDSGLREKSEQALFDEIKRAGQIGAFCVVLHPGAAVSSSRKQAIAGVAESLFRVLEGSINPEVGIALENTAGQGSSLGNTVDDMAAIMDALGHHPRIGVCLDTAHAFAAGIDLRRSEIMENWLGLYEEKKMLERIWVMHLNDSLSKCGSGLDRHTHIGRGEIGDEAFRNILQYQKLQKVPVIIETPKGNDFAGDSVWDRRNLAKLRKLARKGKT